MGNTGPWRTKKKLRPREKKKGGSFDEGDPPLAMRGIRCVLRCVDGETLGAEKRLRVSLSFKDSYLVSVAAGAAFLAMAEVYSPVQSKVRPPSSVPFSLQVPEPLRPFMWPVPPAIL